MAYVGELISIGVAFSWTATALLSEFGSKRLGNLTLNVLRMGLALLFSLVLFGMVTGSMLPPGASTEAAGWMLLSGLVGYVIGDFCLFQCYIIIGYASPLVGSLDGLGDTRSANDGKKCHSDAGDSLGYWHLRARTW